MRALHKRCIALYIGCIAVQSTAAREKTRAQRVNNTDAGILVQMHKANGAV